MRKMPDSLLDAAAETPVSMFVACTFAPTRTASDLSTTRPDIEPRGSWASSTAAPTRKRPTLARNIATSLSKDLTELIRRSILIRQEPVGCVVVGEFLRASVPLEHAVRLMGDVPQQRGCGRNMADLDVGVAFSAALYAVEEIPGMRLRALHAFTLGFGLHRGLERRPVSLLADAVERCAGEEGEVGLLLGHDVPLAAFQVHGSLGAAQFDLGAVRIRGRRAGVVLRKGHERGVVFPDHFERIGDLAIVAHRKFA